MIKIARAGIIINSMVVQLKAATSCIDCYTDRLIGRCFEQIIFRRLGNVLVAINTDYFPLDFFLVAFLVFSVVRVIFLRVQTTILDNKLEGVVHKSSFAALVVALVAVHKLLLTEAHNFSGFDVVYSLYGTGGRKGPARTAHSLILDLGHGPFLPPVYGHRKFAEGKVAIHESGEFVFLTALLKTPFSLEAKARLVSEHALILGLCKVRILVHTQLHF